MIKPSPNSLCLTCDHLQRDLLPGSRYDWRCACALTDSFYPAEPAQPVRSCPEWRLHAGIQELHGLERPAPDPGVKTTVLIAHCPGNAAAVLARSIAVLHAFLEATQGRYVPIAKAKQFMSRDFMRKLELDGRSLRAWAMWLDDRSQPRPVAAVRELYAWLAEMDDRTRDWRWHCGQVLHPGRVTIHLEGRLKEVPLAVQTLFQACGAQSVSLA
jgi:hypothetical protein